MSKYSNAKNHPKPFISKKLVEKKIQQAKNTKGGVQGDLPVRLAKEFSEELAVPAAQIFNKIEQSGEWPARLKQEHGVPLKKVKPRQPESES